MTKHIERFEVRNRFTNAVQFTAEIVCAPDAAMSVKRGLAVIWANLSEANLRWAEIGDKILIRFVASASRSDGSPFFWFDTEGGEVICAGCREFTLEEFKAHVATKYPNTPKAEETLRILDFLAAQAKTEVWA